MEIARSLLGMAILLLVAFAISNNRRAIKLRIAASALAAQIAIGALILFVPAGKQVLAGIAQAVNRVLEYGNHGISFMFGGLVDGKMFELFAYGLCGRQEAWNEVLTDPTAETSCA